MQRFFILILLPRTSDLSPSVASGKQCCRYLATGLRANEVGLRPIVVACYATSWQRDAFDRLLLAKASTTLATRCILDHAAPSAVTFRCGPMETVYIETSIISYLVAEPSRDLVTAANQQISRVSAASFPKSAPRCN